LARRRRLAIALPLDLHPSTHTFWIGTAAGVCGGVAIIAFYEALRIAPMSLVAPITASSVAVPIAVSLAEGQIPTAQQTLGICVIVVGVVTISIDRAAASALHVLSHRALALSLVAALGFGGALTLLAKSTTNTHLASAMWATVGLRFGSVVVILGLAFVRRTPLSFPPRSLVLPVAAAGVLEMTANSSYAIATSRGNLAVVTVLSALYPAVTALLAMVVLHERLVRHQWIGVVVAFAGIITIAAATQG